MFFVLFSLQDDTSYLRKRSQYSVLYVHNSNGYVTILKGWLGRLKIPYDKIARMKEWGDSPVIFTERDRRQPPVL